MREYNIISLKLKQGGLTSKEGCLCTKVTENLHEIVLQEKQKNTKHSARLRGQHNTVSAQHTKHSIAQKYASEVLKCETHPIYSSTRNSELASSRQTCIVPTYQLVLTNA